jgi:hypothetical protein
MDSVGYEMNSVELIPDVDGIYRRVHKTFIDQQNRLLPDAFKPIKGGISCDWSKYSTPAETRARARVPADNQVVILYVGEVRSYSPLDVIHSPSRANHAHCEITGLPDPNPARLQLQHKLIRHSAFVSF